VAGADAGGGGDRRTVIGAGRMTAFSRLVPKNAAQPSQPRGPSEPRESRELPELPEARESPELPEARELLKLCEPPELCESLGLCEPPELPGLCELPEGPELPEPCGPCGGLCGLFELPGGVLERACGCPVTRAAGPDTGGAAPWSGLPAGYGCCRCVRVALRGGGKAALRAVLPAGHGCSRGVCAACPCRGGGAAGVPGAEVAAGGGMNASGIPDRLAGTAGPAAVRGLGGGGGPVCRGCALAGCLLRALVFVPAGCLLWVSVPGLVLVLRRGVGGAGCPVHCSRRSGRCLPQASVFVQAKCL